MNFPLSSSNARRTSAAPAQSVSVSNSAGSIVPRIVLRGLFGTVGTKSSAADHDAEHCRDSRRAIPAASRTHSGYCESRYAHQLAKTSFGSTHRFPFRVTGQRCTAARPAAVVGVRACVGLRPSRQSAGSESHYSSRYARTCGDMYLILDGPTFERPGPVGDRSSTIDGARKNSRSFMAAVPLAVR
jgi:hypothetical protein